MQHAILDLSPDEAELEQYRFTYQIYAENLLMLIEDRRHVLNTLNTELLRNNIQAWQRLLTPEIFSLEILDDVIIPSVLCALTLLEVVSSN